MSSDNDTFSFRWGIDLLDKGQTQIPNFFFDHYTEAGLSRTEFLLILHLARYKYETPKSQSRPAISTVARQMGYQRRYVQKLLMSLEEKKLLRRHYRYGDTTIYDFSGFARKMLALSLGGVLQDTPEQMFKGRPTGRGGDVLQDAGGASYRTPKEQKQEEKQTRKDGDGDGSVDVRFALLAEFGMDLNEKIKGLATQYTLGQIDYAIERARTGQNPQGLLFHFMSVGLMPDPTDTGWRTCVCGRQLKTTWGDWCDDCGTCDRCCTCYSDDEAVEMEPVDVKADEMWQAVLGELQLQMTRVTFSAWFKSTRAISYEDGTLVVGVESERVKDWLSHRLIKAIQRTADSVAGHEVAIEFTVEA